MDLSKIISIGGKPGLFRVVGQMKNGMVVESLLDGKRTPAYATQQISALEDISIYTADDDVPLQDVFEMIHNKEEGGKALSPKSDSATLSRYFEEVFPDYDEDRVYVSDIKKVLKWYNLLLEKDILDFSKEEETNEEEASAEATASEEGSAEATASDEEAPAAEATAEAAEETSEEATPAEEAPSTEEEAAPAEEAAADEEEEKEA